MNKNVKTETVYGAETAGASVCAEPKEASEAAAAKAADKVSRAASYDNENGAGVPDKTNGAAAFEKPTETTVPKAHGKATYTADEVRALLQSEGDRRVAGAKKKWERETEEKIAATAAGMAADMTESLRAEADGLRRALGEAEAARAARERELSLVAALGERGLPRSLLPMILPAEAGTETALIDALCAVVDGMAKREVEARLKSCAPAAASGKRLPTADEVRTLPVAKLAELMR